MSAGRRSGKTEIAKRKVVLEALDCFYHPKPWENPAYFVACPTRPQVKRVYWNDLKRLVHPSWVRSISETDLCITLRWGAEIWCVGLDQPQRLEGSPWDGGIVDEYASCKPGIFDGNIRPMLADRGGWLWLVGVPDFAGPAQGEYAEMVRVAKAGTDPEWGAYSWASGDILPPEEIESAKRRMDPRMFRQEMLGEFVAGGGRAFPDFSLTEHPAGNLGNYEYDPRVPLSWSLDFNIALDSPMCSLIIQEQNGRTVVLKELELSDTRTGVACEEFLRVTKEARMSLKGLRIYGDASGANKKTTGPSDWNVVRQYLREVEDLDWRVRSGNPRIRDTVNAVNGRLMNALGQRNLVFNRAGCRRILRDLEEAVWPSGLEDNHSLAALRYYVHAEYPVAQPAPSDVGRIIIHPG